MPRNSTPVVTGRPRPSGKKLGIVASATVKGLNGFWIGTLMPNAAKAYVSAWDLEWVGNQTEQVPGTHRKMSGHI